MKKALILPLSLMFVSILLFWQQNTAVASVHSTLRIEKYGIEFSLVDKEEESRWRIKDLSRKNISTEKKKLVRIAYAKDEYDVANVRLYVQDEYNKMPIEEWIENPIKEVLQRYSGGGYSVEKRLYVKKIIASGEIVSVKYKTLFINGYSRNIAFVYFTHNRRYYFFFVSNYGGDFKVNGFVEKILLPGIVLF